MNSRSNNDDNYNHSYQMTQRNPTFVQNMSNWKTIELQMQAIVSGPRQRPKDFCQWARVPSTLLRPQPRDVHVRLSLAPVES